MLISKKIVVISMPVCPNCGSIVDDKLTNCPFCKSPLVSKHSNREIAKIEPQPEGRISNSSSETIFNQERQKPSFLSQEPFEEEKEQFILHTPSIEELEEVEHEVAMEQAMELEAVPERRYWLWLILGIVTAGIAFLIYLFLNIEDLERHSFYPLESRAEPIKVSTSQTMMVFLVAICFGFIPILWWIYYKKYASLYYHIREQKQQTAPKKIPHPVWYMLPLVSSHLLALVPAIITFTTGQNIQETLPALFWSLLAVILLLTAINFILDFLWQSAFNAHLRLTSAALALKQAQQAFPQAKS